MSKQDVTAVLQLKWECPNCLCHCTRQVGGLMDSKSWEHKCSSCGFVYTVHLQNSVKSGAGEHIS